MKKPKFIRLKAIWNIIRGRTVVYKAEFKDGTLLVKNVKSVIAYCTFDNTEVK